VRKDIPQWTASIVVAACVACSGSQLAAQEGLIKVEITRNDLGMPPADFELARTGEGDLGQWTVVRDPTASEGIAIEHLSNDQHDDRFPLAIYKRLSAENVEVSVRFKIVSGTLQTAGIALCVRNPDSYYAIAASALEHRVDLLVFANGKSERVEGAEAEIMPNRWHTLGVKVNDDHFAISLDNQLLFTTFERARMKDGRIALWTQEDNVTRFDQLEIRVLPATEWR
jgi:hypothetical protein